MRPWTAPTTPAETVAGALGGGGMTETALIAKVMNNHALTFEWASVAVKNSIVTLVQEGLIEQIAPGVSAYQLTKAACLGAKGDGPEKKKAPKTVAGYRNYSKEDVTPRTGSPGLSVDGSRQ